MNTRHFNINTQGTDYFVGDIHGQYSLFMSNLADLDFDFENDRVFSVGDLIDRGPSSESAIRLLEQPWFHAVLGNHEDFLLGSHSHHTWCYNGGGWSMDHSDEELYEMRDLVVDKMYQTLTVDTEFGKIGVVHAESEDDWNHNSELSRQKNLWARTRISCGQDMPINNIDQVVVGHTPLKKVVRLGNILYIDTGAFSTGILTVLTANQVFNGDFKRVGL